MIAGKSVLAIIPARGGSKGIPRKNIVEVCGRPLIAWTLSVAAASRYIDRYIVSTDDHEIAAVAEKHGAEVPFLRSAQLATDEADSCAVVLDALERLQISYDIVVLLQPTSPLRSVEDIDACVETCAEIESPCVSVTPVRKSPYWMYTRQQSGRIEPLFAGESRATRRQDLEPVYALNGAVYAVPYQWLLRERSFVGPAAAGYVMPPERSLDIDEPTDLEYFEFLIRRQSI